MKTTKALATLATLGSAVALLIGGPSASAQLAFRIYQPAGAEAVLDDLKVGGGSGTQASPIKLTLDVKEIQKAGQIEISGITKVGAVGTEAYRNSVWLEITLRNQSANPWDSVTMAIFNKLMKQISTDGLSFGSLSDRSAHLLKPDAKTVMELGVNPWGYTGAIGDRAMDAIGWNPEYKWPNGAVIADFMRFAAAAEDEVEKEESVTIKILVSQNGKDDNAFLHVSAVPEIPWTGVVTVSLLGAFAILRRRFQH